MITGLMCGVVIAETVALIALIVIVDRIVAAHLRMVRQQHGLPDDTKPSGTKVISPYREDKHRSDNGGDRD